MAQCVGLLRCLPSEPGGQVVQPLRQVGDEQSRRRDRRCRDRARSGLALRVCRSITWSMPRRWIEQRPALAVQVGVSAIREQSGARWSAVEGVGTARPAVALSEPAGARDAARTSGGHPRSPSAGVHGQVGCPTHEDSPLRDLFYQRGSRRGRRDRRCAGAVRRRLHAASRASFTVALAGSEIVLWQGSGHDIGLHVVLPRTASIVRLVVGGIQRQGALFARSGVGSARLPLAS